MKRLRHKLFNGLAVVSVLLCVATVVLWVRSYRFGQMWTRGHNEMGADTRRSVTWQLATGRGSVAYALYFFDIRGLGYIKPQDLALLRALWSLPGNRDARRYQTFHGPNYRPRMGLSTTMGFGFSYHRDVLRPQTTGTSWSVTVTAPYWAVMVACAFPLLGRIGFAVYCRRRLAGQVPPPHPRCVACGYDLRETPNRCPECGTMPSEKIKMSN